jgi:nucleoside-diphosphate-sugar epimerase
VEGDAMNAADVMEAAVSADLIVHAVNPPGYRNWRGLALPMLDNTIAAAKANGARIMFPGTVYNYGPDAFPALSEDAPQNPKTRKGRIRVEMEEKLRAASDAGTRVLVVRAGDFFGPQTGNSWLAQGMVKPGKPVTSVTHPGRPGAGHAWAYLPDYAEAVAQLVEQDGGLSPFETFHFGGHWFADGREMAEAVRRAAERPRAAIKPFPWLAVTALSPFVRLFREMQEMKYLWEVSVRLDNTKLIRVLGKEPHTPIDAALRQTLAGMGCLPETEALPGPLHLREN